MGVYSVDKLISEARKLAIAYRQATGQPLAISGEIARADAARLLDLELCDRAKGYDAVGREGERKGRRYQIKARAIFDENRSDHRIGQLKLEQEWDAVLLVLMDDQLLPTEIYEADRGVVEEALQDVASSRRNNRGAMSVARFKIISQLVWSRESGELSDEVWDNLRDR